MFNISRTILLLTQKLISLQILSIENFVQYFVNSLVLIFDDVCAIKNIFNKYLCIGRDKKEKAINCNSVKKLIS